MPGSGWMSKKKKELSWDSLAKMDPPAARGQEGPPRDRGGQHRPGGRPQQPALRPAADPPPIPRAQGLIPIRREAANVLATGLGQCHVGLAFDRFASTWRKDPSPRKPEQEWNVEPWEERRGPERVSRHPKKEFYHAICELARATKNSGAPLLEGLRGRRDLMVADLAAEGWAVRVTTLTSLWRTVSGLGLPHPFETGLLFDRVCGVPYFPGSSVKGAARAYADAMKLGDATAIFGGGAGQGGVVFFDAYPVTWPELWLDVLTPHYKDYYQGGKPPGDWSSPEPAYFISVAPGLEFEFCIACRPGGRSEELADAAIGAIRGAATEQGLGGKTGVGYGAFG